MKNPNRTFRPFEVTSPQDFTIICSVAGTLHCSTATIYRTIKEYKVPVWHFIECLVGRRFISCFNWYTLIKSPAFKKYFKQLTNFAEIRKAKEYEVGTPLSEVAEKLNLNEWEIDAGVKSGLIPCIKINNNIMAVDWFLPATESVYPWFH